MNDTKTVWFSVFRRVVPADYERWLESMEVNGWHLKKIGQWSSIAMRFTKGVEHKYRYVYDMQPFMRKDYIPTYEQFGWEFVGRMASACIWRMPYTSERPEAFSDAESMKGRNTRNLRAASVVFWLFLAMVVLLAVPAVFFPASLGVGGAAQLFWAMGFCAVCTLLMGLVLLTLRKNR